MKKGITLIELLSVIIILSIVLLIAIPQILKIVEQSKTNILINNETILAEAAKRYFIQNKNLLPSQLGDTNFITVNELVNAKFLKPIVNIEDKSQTCDGYVLVTKLEESVNYSPHIKCNNLSYEEDKLVLHYKFADFQEPTVNISKDTYNFYAPYHSVVQDGSNLTFTMINANRYLVIRNTDLGALYGRTFTYSGYMKKNNVPYIPSDIRVNSYNSIGSITNYKTDANTGYFEATMYFNHETTNWLVHWPIVNSDGDVITIRDFQIEEKFYRTPHTPDVRGGLVKDYSVNNKHATLNLNNTPRYINNSYEFNGSNSLLRTDEVVSLEPNQTYCAYINPNTTSGLRGIVSHHNHSQTANIGLNLLNSNRLGVSIGYTDNTREYQNKLSSGSIPINEYTFVCLVFDNSNNKVRYYINSELDSEHNVTKPVKFINERVTVGQWANSYIGGYVFSGLIADVRIYNRILNQDEIIYLYKTQYKS